MLNNYITFFYWKLIKIFNSNKFCYVNICNKSFIYYLYLYSILFYILLIFIITVFYLFIGKFSMLKYFNYLKLMLFFISLLTQYSVLNNDNLVINLNIDFLQNYIFFYTNPINFEVSKISIFFSATTLQISYFANLFSFYYMSSEKKFERFYFFLNYFVISMVLLLHTSNFITLFLFWEMIGITSYFLINHYELRVITFKSSLKALSFNRLSDVCILFSIIIYFKINNTFFINNAIIKSMYLIGYNNSIFGVTDLKIFILLLLIACSVKSAQFILHLWLPDSMEAPIPASALIHSATLVSAGIFFFFKFKLVLMSNTLIISAFALLNSITILYGSIIAFFQTDLKKILAYSTIGNCGLMFLAAQFLTINEFLFIFYLHGTSKALSFLFCGFIINLNYHNQDMRLLGGLNFTNYSYIFNIIFSLSMLAAWPFTVFGIIKHGLVNSITCNNLNYINIFIVILGFFFSFCYSLKIIKFLFYSFLKSKKSFYYANNKEVLLNINYIKVIVLFSIFCILFFFLYFFKLNFLTNNMISLSNYTFLKLNTLVFLTLLCIFTLFNSGFSNNYSSKKIIVISLIMLFI